LGVLYPHYLAPIPSMAVVQLGLDPAQQSLTAGHVVPRHTALETEPIGGEPCRFRTGYAATLWPIDVESAALGRPPFAAPPLPGRRDVAAILRLSLACRSPSATFPALAPGSLRFFLKAQPQHVHKLYELILNDTVAVALAGGPDDPAATLRGP